MITVALQVLVEEEEEVYTEEEVEEIKPRRVPSQRKVSMKHFINVLSAFGKHIQNLQATSKFMCLANVFIISSRANRPVPPQVSPEKAPPSPSPRLPQEAFLPQGTLPPPPRLRDEMSRVMHISGSCKISNLPERDTDPGNLVFIAPTYFPTLDKFLHYFPTPDKFLQ